MQKDDFWVKVCMDLIKLKNSELALSRIVFGGAAISGEGRGYGFGEMTDSEASKLIEYALDRGVNTFDTAPIYGFGESERKLGINLKKVRDKVYLVSKGGVDWHGSGRVNMSNEPKIIKKMLDESLKRLGNEYIDLYMIHWPDKKVDIRYALEVLIKAQNQKKINSIGLCNTTDLDIKLAREVCEVDFIQAECNLFQNHFETLSVKDDYFSMGWGTLDKGILTGRLSKDSRFHKDDCRSWAPWWKKSNWKDKTEKVNELNNNFSQQNSFDLAINYSKQKVDFTLCGFKTNAQLDSLIESMKKNIPKDTMCEVVDFVRN